MFICFICFVELVIVSVLKLVKFIVNVTFPFLDWLYVNCSTHHLQGFNQMILVNMNRGRVMKLLCFACV